MSHRLERYFEFGPTQHDAFDDLLNKTKVAIMVVVVQPHCPHCVALKPHLKKLKDSLEPDEDKAKVVILDSAATNASKSKAVKGITGVPTIRGILRKKHIREHEGSNSSEALEQFLASLDEEAARYEDEDGEEEEDEEQGEEGDEAKKATRKKRISQRKQTPMAGGSRRRKKRRTRRRVKRHRKSKKRMYRIKRKRKNRIRSVIKSRRRKASYKKRN